MAVFKLNEIVKCLGITAKSNSDLKSKLKTVAGDLGGTITSLFSGIANLAKNESGNFDVFTLAESSLTATQSALTLAEEKSNVAQNALNRLGVDNVTQPQIDAAQAQVDATQAQVATAKSELKSAKSKFDKAKKAIDGFDLTESAQGYYDDATKKITEDYTKYKTLIGNVIQDGKSRLTCSGAEKSTQQEPLTNTIAALDATPNSNDDDVNTSSPDAENKHELKKSENKGLDSVVTVVDKIHNEIPKKGTSEYREYVRQISSIHPNIEPYISKLEHFQPVSESTGAWVIAYTPDKASLQLEDWKNQTLGSLYTPTSIRRNIKEKLKPERVTAIETAYVKLNEQLLNNLPNEFFSERKVKGVNMANSHHLAGDYLYSRDHMAPNSSLVTQFLEQFKEQLGESIQRINYFVPIRENRKITQDLYVVEQEDHNLPTMVLDKRKNLARLPFKTVNNDALVPVKPDEEKQKETK